jgi:hypothetical protein
MRRLSIVALVVLAGCTSTNNTGTGAAPESHAAACANVTSNFTNGVTPCMRDQDCVATPATVTSGATTYQCSGSCVTDGTTSKGLCFAAAGLNGCNTSTDCTDPKLSCCAYAYFEANNDVGGVKDDTTVCAPPSIYPGGCGTPSGVGTSCHAKSDCPSGQGLLCDTNNDAMVFTCVLACTTDATCRGTTCGPSGYCL